MELFRDAVQAFFAPLTVIAFLTYFIINDKLFEKKIKKFFLLAEAICLLIIAATWADKILIGSIAEYARYVRRVTSTVAYSFCPFAPAILLCIYNEGDLKQDIRFYVPLLANVAACIISFFTGIIFTVTVDNVYKRGILFVLPYLIMLFYMLSLIYFAMKQSKPSKRIEMIFLTGAMSAIAVATVLEIVFEMEFMIWSATTVAIALYYTVLVMQKILYEPLTGAFSRTSYFKELEIIDGRKWCVFTVIDINNLKKVNDKYGHAYGDELIKTVADKIMIRTTRRSRLYRTGGDEFMLITYGNHAGIIEYSLEKILHEDFAEQHSDELGRISFAYGAVEYYPHQELQKTLEEADQKMYEKKQAMKQNRATSALDIKFPTTPV